MESLLRWGIQNSAPHDPNQPPPRPRTDLDPGVIDAILGKSDAVLMKEALAVALDDAQDEDARLQALDDFEMLIEQIDNANNLEKLKMWEPLHNLLDASSPDSIRTATLWILGTAVQNNPAAQHSYLALSPLPTLLSLLSAEVTRSPKTRGKAMYALSGLLKHSAAAVKQLDAAGGWDVLKGALSDSEIAVRRKAAFLLNALLVPATPSSSYTSASTASPTSAPVPTSTTSAAPPQPAPGPSASSSSAVVLHESAQPADPAPGAAPAVVHPNSHASMVADPSSFSTSPATLRAFEERGVLTALVSALADPVPFGPDGEHEGDVDFEEQVLKALHTYVGPCARTLPESERKALRGFLEEQAAKVGEADEGKLAGRWGLTVEEFAALKKAAA